MCRLKTGEDVACVDSGRGISLMLRVSIEGGEEFIHTDCEWGEMGEDVELSSKKRGGQAICIGSEQFMTNSLMAKGRDGELDAGAW